MAAEAEALEEAEAVPEVEEGALGEKPESAGVGDEENEATEKSNEESDKEGV
jgi:hypothetical protein